MDFFSQIYKEIQKDEIAFLFFVWISVWLILAVALVLFFRIFPLSWQKRINSFIEITPNGLATLGVLGTFTGILIGLLDFKVDRIDESVPALLEGLKVAFTTSIVGLGAAVFFRIIRLFQPSGDAEIVITPEDIHATLVEIRDESREHAKSFAEQFTQLRQVISSDMDSSLLTQIQKLRTTIQDGQNELTGEFRKFAETMVENNQKALIEALEEVIRDFNAKLTEQFGENFKQLNEAVHHLVEWQERYRVHVEALEERLETAVSSIEAAQRALEAVRDHSERIPEAIRPLENVLNAINAQVEDLDDHLQAFAGLRDRAMEAFPVIEANLKKVTTQLTTSVEEAVTMSRQALAEEERAHAELRQGYSVLLGSAEEMRERFASDLSRALDQHKELIQESAEKAQQSIDSSWQQSVERINDQFTRFDEQMQQELTRSLELLGRNLASISEKMTSDYRKNVELVEQLTKLIDELTRVLTRLRRPGQ